MNDDAIGIPKFRRQVICQILGGGFLWTKMYTYANNE